MDIKEIIKNFKTDKKSMVPLYHQIYNFLRDAIKNKLINQGLLLPTEKELCNSFKCSIITIRRALRELELEGFIERKPGVGTFIINKTHETEIIMKDPFSTFEWSQRRSTNTKLKVLRNEVITPTKAIQNIMGINENSKVLVIERFTTIDKEPMDLVISYFPHDIFNKIDDKIILSNSFTKIVTEIFKLKILRREILIEADVPNNRISKLLQIKEGDKKVIQHMTTNWVTRYKSRKIIIHHDAFFHRSKGRFFFVF